MGNSNSGRNEVEIPPKELLSHIEAGRTDEEIAKIYYVSVRTVEKRRYKYGFYRKPNNFDKGMYLRMKELGISDRKCAYIFGVIDSTFRTWKNREGI